MSARLAAAAGRSGNPAPPIRPGARRVLVVFERGRAGAAALDAAAELAGADGELSVVTLAPQAKPLRCCGGGGAGPYNCAVAEEARSELQQARRALDRAATKATFTVLAGHPEPPLAEWASEHGIEVAVLPARRLARRGGPLARELRRARGVEVRVVGQRRTLARSPPGERRLLRRAAERTSEHRQSEEAATVTEQAKGEGTAEDPWQLTTPPGKASYVMWREEQADPPALVCQVGATQLRYHLRAIDDLHAMLLAHGDWIALGGADEQKPAPEGTVEAWGRSPENPVRGWYGLKKGLRGRFGVYLPPLLEALGLAEVTHEARNNQMRALG